MRSIITTHRPWYQRLLDIVADSMPAASRHTSLRQLSARELADIGVDASEIASIQAEARGLTATSRLRIVASSHYA
jgi:uncharacterized protein YjiS (DUF1127 family)